MFGSKLRSWMENHIVRSRKKGNKNKNSANGGGESTPAELHKNKHAAQGFTIYHHHGSGGANSCSPPYKSNGNSQSNSSGGHHAACNGVISSPNRRREVSPIQSHTQSRYGWQSPDREHVISPKSENFLYAPQHHSQQYLRNHHTAPNTRENSCEERPLALPGQQQQPQHQQQQQHQLNCSTSSFSSLSWSTGSKEPSMHSNINGQISSSVANNTTATTTSTNGIHMDHQASYTSEEQKLSDEDPNAVHYEEIGTLIRNPEKLLHNILSEIERPKSEQFPHVGQRIPHFCDEKQTQDDASTRYGRLLPSKIQNPTIIGFRTGSEECIPRQGCNGTMQQHSNYPQPPPQHSAYLQPRSNASRTKLRNGSGAPPSAPGVPLVSLSSPESAYSTGYSTDGTSPGAGYTPPEYYVNMRTGTHYFPKSVNSLAIEAQRYKFGLNKIEEMSPIDPLPKTPFAQRNLEDSDSGLIKKSHAVEPYDKSAGHHSPLPIRNTIVIPTLKGFESPSPRQRCRIRTNPWYSTTETSSSGSTMHAGAQQALGAGGMTSSQLSSMTISSTSSHSTSALSTIHLEPECEPELFHRAAASSTTGIKSSRNCTSGKAGAGGAGAVALSLRTSSSSGSGSASASSTSHNNNSHQLHNNSSSCNNNNKNLGCGVSSDSSSSLTEVENAQQRPYTPNTVRRKRSLQLHYHSAYVAGVVAAPTEPVASSPRKKAVEAPLAAVSDDDATLNEMMGKFDESYIYEKETDILSSDSDPTDCPTDLDTGLDAGDECDTDDLLDIDFIDTSSMQEMFDQQDQIYIETHHYANGSPVLCQRKVSTRSRHRTRSIRMNGEQSLLTAAAGSAQKRRKRFHKTRKKSAEGKEHGRSPMRASRETRSVGGTPVCLRKNLRVGERQRYSQTTPHQLSHRSSSLVFSDVRESRFMTIAESEKALLKADFEADVKYKQLIMEAESILVSMRNSVQSIPRETPVASPRRVNPLANKRVEMIKNCEMDMPRPQSPQPKSSRCSEMTEQELTAAVNKRIELLKLETQSPPGSPKLGACSPRKTHLTNFINQNIPSEPGSRKSLNSPLVQRRSLSPTASPLQKRRLSAGPKLNVPAVNSRMSQLSDSSDQDYNTAGLKLNDRLNHNYVASGTRQESLQPDYNDVRNQNVVISNGRAMEVPRIQLNYCPQSEPLKRKVYKSQAGFQQHHGGHENGEERHHMRPNQLQQQRLKAYNSGSSDFALQRRLSAKLRASSRDGRHSSMTTLKTDYTTALTINTNISNTTTTTTTEKAALILSTIADLKRNLEHQSLQLSGLNET